MQLCYKKATSFLVSIIFDAVVEINTLHNFFLYILYFQDIRKKLVRNIESTSLEFMNLINCNFQSKYVSVRIGNICSK